LVSIFFGELYNRIFSQSGTYVDMRVLSGIPFAYIFFLLLLFTAFGDAKKYWWITIALIPAVLFEVAFDLQHIYFPVAIGLVAWLLGKGVNMLVAKYKL
jgi:hypothetical protein